VATGDNRFSGGPESSRGLTLIQLQVLDDAYCTSMAWLKISAKYGINRQEITYWRNSPAWKAEWKRRDDLVIEAQDHNLKRSVEVASRVLIELAEGRGTQPRMDKNNNILGGAPAPVPYAVMLRASEILATVGQRIATKSTPEDEAISELARATRLDLSTEEGRAAVLADLRALPPELLAMAVRKAE
jgi:hypothetical protein